VTRAYGTASALTTSYSYDELGNLVDMTDEAGVITHNEYDAAGRLTRTTRNYDPHAHRTTRTSQHHRIPLRRARNQITVMTLAQSIWAALPTSTVQTGRAGHRSGEAATPEQNLH
jgi:YD repeat-containing protein